MNGKRMMLAAVALIILAPVSFLTFDDGTGDADAALGSFTGGANVSSPSNPYTGIDCDVPDLDTFFAFDSDSVAPYYVELGSVFDITGMDPADEFQHQNPNYMVMTARNQEWTAGNFRGFFYDIGECDMSVAEDHAVRFHIVCNNTTKVESVSVSGSSAGSITVGYHSDGQKNAERNYAIYTTPRYSATPAPTTMVDIRIVSGYNVVSWWMGISASGLVPYLYFTPKAVGTAVFEISATDGGGASTTLTVNVNEYRYATLEFDANGGTGAPAPIEDDTYTGKFYFDIPAEKPTRTGYEFLGWATSPSATVPEYDYEDVYNDRFSTTDGSNTLYAVWERAVRTFTATLDYDANGGDGAPLSQTASIEAVSASGSKTFVIPSTFPTRSGYEFRGWSTSDTAQTASYRAGSSVSVAYGSSITLHAVWQQAVVTVSGVPDGNGIVGTAWSYTPTLSTEGCTLSVSGAPWLVVSGDTVSGTPTASGTYDITITATKPGHIPGTQCFSVTVYSSLSFQSSPTGGAIIYAV